MSSIKALRAKTQTVHAGDPSVVLIRAVSIYLTWVGIKLRLTANQVSVANIGISIAIGALFLFGTPAAYIFAAALMVLGMILDSVDGELARYWEQSSLTGLLLDRLNSAFVYPFTFFGMGAGLALETGQNVLFVVGFLAGWSLMALRLVKTSVDATVVDALTAEKARMEDGAQAAAADTFTVGAEAIRSRKGLIWTLLDFFLVREIGVVAAVVGAVTFELIARAFVTTPYGGGPMAIVVLGYAVVGSLATLVGIAHFVRSRVAEKNYQAVRLLARR